MAYETMATAAEALKTYYLDAIKYQLNEKPCAILAQFERNSKDVSGTKVKMPLKYGVSGGVASRTEDGDLPTPYARQYKQAEWETKNLYARLQLTDKLMKASRNRKGSFVNQLDAQLEDLLADAKLQLSRQVVGDGTGKLAEVATDATSSVNVTADNVQYLMEGMIIDFVAKADGTPVSGATGLIIEAIDRTTKVITLSSAVTVAAATDMIVTSGAYGLELTGLKKVFDHTNFGTIYGIDRANTYKWFRANTIAINGELDELKMQEGLDEVEIATGEPVNFLVASYGVRRAYYYLMSSLKRMVNTIEIKGGFKAPEFNGLPLVADRFMPEGTMYGLNTNDWNLYEIGDWDWLDEDGGILTRVAGKPIWEATLVKYCDIGCSRLRGQVQWTGIVEH